MSLHYHRTYPFYFTAKPEKNTSAFRVHKTFLSLFPRYQHARRGLDLLSEELRAAEARQSQLTLDQRQAQAETNHLRVQLAELTLDNQEIREENHRLHEYIRLLSPTETTRLENKVYVYYMCADGFSCKLYSV